MNKKIFYVALCAMLFALSYSASAQQPKKVPRIGYLAPTDPSCDLGRAEAIRLALREFGYVEGRNLAFEYRYAGGKPDRYPELAAELVRLKVDIILVGGSDAQVRAAKNATKSIPIVMMGRGIDPVEAGLVDSLARPGGNVTGITNISGEQAGSGWNCSKKPFPNLLVSLFSRCGQSVQCTGSKRGPPSGGTRAEVDYSAVGGESCERFRKSFCCDGQQRPDGLYVLGGALMVANQKRIIGFALKSRLPSMYIIGEAVEAGGLMSYGADIADSYRRVAYFVDKILKGTKPF